MPRGRSRGRRTGEFICLHGQIILDKLSRSHRNYQVSAQVAGDPNPKRRHLTSSKCHWHSYRLMELVGPLNTSWYLILIQFKKFICEFLFFFNVEIQNYVMPGNLSDLDFTICSQMRGKKYQAVSLNTGY